MKHYAIRRPDGSWIMATAKTVNGAWFVASDVEPTINELRCRVHSWLRQSEALGYRCVEVSGFTEVENG